MKKVFTSLLIFILLSVTAYADEAFTLRNGIQFGDSFEVVKKKETLPVPKTIEGNSFSTSGEVAGLSNCSVKYTFDESTGGLVDMYYIFDNHKEQSETEREYNSIRDGLIRKYGEPVEYNLSIRGKVIEHIVALMYLFEGQGGKFAAPIHEAWIVTNENYYVLIQLIPYKFLRSSQETEISYAFDLGYRIFTDDDIEEDVQKKIEKNEEVDRDL